MTRGKSLYLVAGILAAFIAQAAVDPQTVASRLVDRCIEYYKRGDLARATAELRKALKILPNDSQIHFMLGNALYRSGDMRGAAESYHGSLALRPNHIEARMSRGFTLFEIGDYSEATAEWEQAVKLDPHEPFARAGLAVGLYKLGRLDQAGLQYCIAMAIDGRYADPDALAIDIRWTAKSREVLKQLISRNGSQPCPPREELIEKQF